MSNDRRFLALGGLCALAIHAAPVANAADLTVGAFGGVWEQALRECAVAPFEAKTGKTVDIVLGAPVQWMNQIAASPSKPPLDVIFMPSDNAFDVVDKGLADKLTVETTPIIAKLAPKFAQIGDGYGVVHNYGSMGLIYNSKTVKNPPASWKEFFDRAAKGEWAVSIPSVNYPGALSTVMWHLAELYGGGIDNIAPAVDMLKKIKATGSLVFWSDPNQVLNGLKSGQTDIAMHWDGRAWAFIDDGNADFKYVTPKPGSVGAMTWIQKVKNGSDLGWDFVNSTLDAKIQGCFGSKVRYGVANMSATFDEKVKHEITRFDELIFPPFREIIKRQAGWIETWNKEIGR
jgi:putative spermidine/putrescine transport system substrate-binding protein